MDSITKSALLLNAVKAPCRIFIRLCREYDPEELWHSRSLWTKLGLAKRMQERLDIFLSGWWAEKEEERTENFSARFITALDIDYPVKLSELSNPPVGFYIKGGVNLSLPSVAIVGTRKCSDYAQSVAVNLGRALAENGITTLSGGARGIDTAGHRGTLSKNGKTVVIFGTGLDKTYPAENRDLFSRILERGAWVSEYPFGTDGNAWRFPERDRLIAAIAARVVIAESPEDGGAMHTARKAIELGREVWSIPGRIIDEVSRGTNMLMREGANTFIDIPDFVKSVKFSDTQINIGFDTETDSYSETETETLTAPSYELSNDEKILYSLLQRQGGRTIDDLGIESGIDFASVSIALNDLEVAGLIISSSGRYSVSA